jgi:hypothetical protein
MLLGTDRHRCAGVGRGSVDLADRRRCAMAVSKSVPKWWSGAAALTIVVLVAIWGSWWGSGGYSDLAAGNVVLAQDQPAPEARGDRPAGQGEEARAAEDRPRDPERGERRETGPPDREQAPREGRGEARPEGRPVERPEAARPIRERLAQRRQELLEAAEALRREIRELGEAHPDRREALRQKLEAIERELGALERGERPRPPIPPEQIGERIADLERQLEESEEARDERRIRALRGELERLRAMMARLAGAPEARPERRPEGPPGPPEGSLPPEQERRLHHLRVAIENLHEAGFPELARWVEEAAEKIRPGRPPGPPDRPGPPAGAPELKRIGEAVRGLLERTEHLGKRVDELAARIRELEARVAPQRQQEQR